MTDRHYQTITDGEWVRPIMKGWRMKCCQCRHTHVLEFRVIRWGRGHKVEFRAHRVRQYVKRKPNAEIQRRRSRPLESFVGRALLPGEQLSGQNEDDPEA